MKLLNCWGSEFIFGQNLQRNKAETKATVAKSWREMWSRDEVWGEVLNALGWSRSLTEASAPFFRRSGLKPLSEVRGLFQPPTVSGDERLHSHFDARQARCFVTLSTGFLGPVRSTPSSGDRTVVIRNLFHLFLHQLS